MELKFGRIVLNAIRAVVVVVEEEEAAAVAIPIKIRYPKSVDLRQR
jgi:hypothetical protein